MGERVGGIPGRDLGAHLRRTRAQKLGLFIWRLGGNQRVQGLRLQLALLLRGSCWDL